MRIKNPGTRWQLLFKIERTSEEFYRKAFGLEFMKRATGMSSRMLKVRNCNLVEGSAPSRGKNKGWALSRVHPPPKRKKTLLAALA
jgi:hypothetical protein